MNGKHPSLLPCGSHHRHDDSLDKNRRLPPYCHHASLDKLDIDMQEDETRPADSKHEPGASLDNADEPLLGSGFEDEQPEPDFDERI